MPVFDMLSPWLAHLILGLILVARIGGAGFILARSGRSPLWALAILVPLVSIVGLWVFAFVRWPRLEPADKA